MLFKVEWADSASEIKSSLENSLFSNKRLSLEISDLSESNFSVEVLNLMPDDALLVEVEGERVEAEDQARHVLLVVDVGRLGQK